MKHATQTVLATTAIALCTLHAGAQAQTTPATAPATQTAYELAYNAGVVSDYRYRGVSQTRLQPALQGGIDLTAGAFYAGAWASNIQWLKDAGLNGNIELDVYGGYKWALTSDTTLDFGALTYIYPSNNASPNANTTEVFVGAASGPFSAKYSHAVSNLFGFTSSKGSGYLEANVDYELVKGSNLVAHIGRQSVKNSSTASYTDYKLGVTHEALGGKFSASVIATNNKTYVSPAGKNLGKAGLVVAYTTTF